MNAKDKAKTFDQAMLLYEAYNALGWGSNPKEIVNKVKQLRQGLPKEDEFIALSVWMGKCDIVHKLDQGQFPSLSKQKYQVPDIFMYCNYYGKNIPVLIEVKSTEDIKFPPFTNNYYNRLIGYAELVGLPLLVAWRVEKLNLWCLFDIKKMQKKKAAFHINFQTAMNNSLLFMLHDDVVIRIEKGTQILMKIRKVIGTEIRDDASGKLKKFKGTLEDIASLNCKGEKIPLNSHLGQFISYAFQLIDNDVTEIENKEYVTLIFHTTKDEDLFAHQFLGLALFGFNIRMNNELSWLDGLQKGPFHMDYQALRNAASEGIDKGVIKMIFVNKPEVPQFLAKY